MPNLTGNISFTATFDFSGSEPVLKLQATSTIDDADKPNLIGHFIITQPDGLQYTADPGTVVWDTDHYTPYNFPLTLCSDETYQKGSYTVVFFASCPGYVYGTFTRTWEMGYKPADLVLKDRFDLFTPQLKYSDLTNYGVGGYTIDNLLRDWNITSAAGDITGNSNEILLFIAGQYYDSTYTINFYTDLTYLHTFYTWLSVIDRVKKKVKKKAYIPPSMAVMLTYLINIRDARDEAIESCNPFAELEKIFAEAEDLYTYIRTRVCAQNTVGLATSFDQFYSLTHNYQPFYYVNTNGVIPGYDFTTGCGGSGGGTGGGEATYPAYYTATVDNETDFILLLPAGARIITVQKGINPLKPDEYSYVSPTMTLLGVALQATETLFITYSLPV